jgi:hypothetical protein
VARAVDRGVQQQVHNRKRGQRHETGTEAHQQHEDHAGQAETKGTVPQEHLV